jgi:hypothetical protein
MTERVEAMGGSLDIRSTPGVGTRVMATVPVPVPSSTDVRSSNAQPEPQPATELGQYEAKHHPV